jgi:RNA polymerase sigma factor (TIGR02999 family)
MELGSGASDVTGLLCRLEEGDVGAVDALLPLVYEELRDVAAAHLRRERAGHTLQATALVNEAYARLVDQTRVQWAGRTHFFAVAATAMRRVLVDHARSRGRLKRGGGGLRVPLPEDAAAAPGPDLLELDEALELLAREHPDHARLVEIRFFGGLSMEDAASLLGVSGRTCERWWRFARAWLYARLGGESGVAP